AETFRDFVQVHLPPLFVESPVRAWLIGSGVLPRVFGQGLGDKLTYAVQKATYDVSTEPYESEIFADGFVVLRHYSAEFPEVFGAQVTDPLDVQLRDSFRAIEPDLFTDTCDARHGVPRNAEYYSRQRRNLIGFARALYYKTILDFAFA